MNLKNEDKGDQQFIDRLI